MSEADEIIRRLKGGFDIDQVDLTTICVANVRTEDYPDFVDAYIHEAFYFNGDMLSEEDLDELNDHGEIVQQAAHDWMF